MWHATCFKRQEVSCIWAECALLWGCYGVTECIELLSWKFEFTKPWRCAKSWRVIKLAGYSFEVREVYMKRFWNDWAFDVIRSLQIKYNFKIIQYSDHHFVVVFKPTWSLASDFGLGRTALTSGTLLITNVRSSSYIIRKHMDILLVISEEEF